MLSPGKIRYDIVLLIIPFTYVALSGIDEIFYRTLNNLNIWLK